MAVNVVCERCDSSWEKRVNNSLVKKKMWPPNTYELLLNIAGMAWSLLLLPSVLESEFTASMALINIIKTKKTNQNTELLAIRIRLIMAIFVAHNLHYFRDNTRLTNDSCDVILSSNFLEIPFNKTTNTEFIVIQIWDCDIIMLEKLFKKFLVFINYIFNKLIVLYSWLHNILF